MQRWSIAPILLVGAVAACLLVGCGKDDTESYGTRAQLLEIHELYRMHNVEHKRPPAKVEDLRSYEPGAPIGYQSLQTGQCLIHWPGIKASGTTILAYEKDVPSKGGLVVTKDRQVKKMTVDEFKAASKN